MARITPIRYKYRKDRDGRYPIYIRIADAKKTRYVSVGWSVKKDDWNERRGEVRKGHRYAPEINKDITSLVDKARDEVVRLRMEGEEPTADAIKAALVPKKEEDPSDFFAFSKRYVERPGQLTSLYTRKRYTSVLKKFGDFAGKPLPFEEITIRLLQDFVDHLLTEHKNSRNTAAGNVRVLKTLYRAAMREGVVDKQHDPFVLFTPPRETRPERTVLTLSEVTKLADVELKEGSDLWHARNAFLFALYAAGARFGDVARMKWENVVGNHLRYVMRKTRKHHAVKVVPPLRALLDKYRTPERDSPFIFPFLDGYVLTDTDGGEDEDKATKATSSQNARVNKALKEVAKLAGVDKHLTMHVARHSYADIARKKGESVYDIQRQLRHSDLRRTDGYLSELDQEAHDESIERVFRK